MDGKAVNQFQEATKKLIETLPPQHCQRSYTALKITLHFSAKLDKS